MICSSLVQLKVDGIQVGMGRVGMGTDGIFGFTHTGVDLGYILHVASDSTGSKQ